MIDPDKIAAAAAPDGAITEPRAGEADGGPEENSSANVMARNGQAEAEPE